MSTVLAFPCGGRIDARDDQDATLRRVRLAAMAAGCNRAQVSLVEAHAEGLLRSARNWRRDQVIQAARSFAAHLLPRVPA